MNNEVFIQQHFWFQVNNRHDYELNLINFIWVVIFWCGDARFRSMIHGMIGKKLCCTSFLKTKSLQFTFADFFFNLNSRRNRFNRRKLGKNVFYGHFWKKIIDSDLFIWEKAYKNVKCSYKMKNRLIVTWTSATPCVVCTFPVMFQTRPTYIPIQRLISI